MKYFVYGLVLASGYWILNTMNPMDIRFICHEKNKEIEPNKYLTRPQRSTWANAKTKSLDQTNQAEAEARFFCRFCLEQKVYFQFPTSVQLVQHFKLFHSKHLWDLIAQEKKIDRLNRKKIGLIEDAG